MMTCYAWLARAAYPLVLLWLKRRAAMGKEDPSRLKERLGHLSIRRPEGRVVWVHAASVGEAMSVLPLLQRLQEVDASLHMVMTTGTVSSAGLMAKHLPQRAYHHYVPVDAPQAVNRFLRSLKPDLAVWVESEFWPNLMRSAYKRKIPMVLVNARLSPRSMKRWQLAGGLFRSLMRCFKAIYAGSQNDKQRLHELGISRVEWAGNLKYDAAVLPSDPELTGEVLHKIGDRRVWLAASTHPGEEELVIEAHKAVRDIFPDIMTVLVPRHPHRAEEIASLISNAKLTFAQRSKRQVILPETDIYLADTLGELGIFYRLSGVAFIGGSLVAHGGHNPIEPAQLDCAILCGPHMHNFTNITETLKRSNAICEVNGAAGLSEAVTELLREQEAQAAMAERAHKAVDLQRGASDQITEKLCDFLGISIAMNEENKTAELEEGAL